jgi:FkbM family methyltransferase
LADDKNYASKLEITTMTIIEKCFQTIRNDGFRVFAAYCSDEIQLLMRGFFRNSYSQHGEDILLDRFLSFASSGVYVDIGAADPIRFSNSYRFYKKGWRGVLIEPNPNRIDRLRAIRSRDTTLNLGVSTSNAELPFFIFDPPNVSTFSDRSRNINVSNGYKYVKTEMIATKSLSDIFDLDLFSELGKIDFLSVDTEGFDMDVLSSNNWTKYRPKFVLVESIEGDSRDVGRFEISRFMASAGYDEVFYNGLNIIFKERSPKETEVL